MVDLKKEAADRAQFVIDARRQLHRIPEVAFTEAKTAAFIEKTLNELGVPVQTGIAEYGLVGTVSGSEPGPTIMIRADMDALPIREETGLPFASEHDGVMHACGHDAHVAMLLGAAAILNSKKDQLKGTIKFVFQPAEEGVGGAKPMIEQGVMENPKVDYAFGTHVWPTIPEGQIGVLPGPAMAAMDTFTIKILGSGGHGAMPHVCIDPVDIGVQVVNALQRLVSRKMKPLAPAVVTIGSFHAGTSFNIIPDEAVLQGTTRTFDREVWASWAERMETVIKGVCESMGAGYEFDYLQKFPPLVNDAAMSDLVRECVIEGFGESCLTGSEPTMGGEDMAFFP